MVQTSDIITLVVFGIVLIGFAWLFYDVRREAREREARDRAERAQLLSVLQQNAVQLPAIATALSQINNNLDELNRHIIPSPYKPQDKSQDKRQ